MVNNSLRVRGLFALLAALMGPATRAVTSMPRPARETTWVRVLP